MFFKPQARTLLRVSVIAIHVVDPLSPLPELVVIFPSLNVFESWMDNVWNSLDPRHSNSSHLYCLVCAQIDLALEFCNEILIRNYSWKL